MGGHRQRERGQPLLFAHGVRRAHHRADDVAVEVLQTTEPAAANVLWEGIDRTITDLAIWLPTTTPNTTDILSPRTGNYQYHPAYGALVDQLWVR